MRQAQKYGQANEGELEVKSVVVRRDISKGNSSVRDLKRRLATWASGIWTGGLAKGKQDRKGS